MEAELIIDDPTGIAALEARGINALAAVQHYGPMIFEFISSTPDYFTLDLIHTMMKKTRYKQLTPATARIYISYVITYVNASALPFTIEQTRRGNRYWWTMKGCNNS